MAITGHKNQQSLTDYSELDAEDHQRLGKILSTVKQPVQFTPEPSVKLPLDTKSSTPEPSSGDAAVPLPSFHSSSTDGPIYQFIPWFVSFQHLQSTISQFFS